MTDHSITNPPPDNKTSHRVEIVIAIIGFIGAILGSSTPILLDKYLPTPMPFQPAELNIQMMPFNPDGVMQSNEMCNMASIDNGVLVTNRNENNYVYCGNMLMKGKQYSDLGYLQATFKLTDGFSVPEGKQTGIYLINKATVNGETLSIQCGLSLGGNKNKLNSFMLIAKEDKDHKWTFDYDGVTGVRSELEIGTAHTVRLDRDEYTVGKFICTIDSAPPLTGFVDKKFFQITPDLGFNRGIEYEFDSNNKHTYEVTNLLESIEY